jgi:hypothetical protein
MVKYNKITTVEEIDIHRCPFCDAVCCVERNKIRPKITGMASSMHWHGTPQIYDEFSCPNNNIKWHKTLMEYHEELNETKSPRLKKLILEDISDLLKLNLEK